MVEDKILLYLDASLLIGGDGMPSCQACQAGVPLINTGFGRPDEPIGACVNCGSLSCGHHGIRIATPKFLCIECEPSLQAKCGVNGRGWIEWYTAYLKKSTGDPKDDDGGGGGEFIEQPQIDAEPHSFSEVKQMGIGVIAQRARRTFNNSFAHPVAEFKVQSVDDWKNRRPEYAELYDSILTPMSDIKNSLARSLDESLFGLAGTGQVTSLQALWQLMDPDARELFALATSLTMALQLPETRMSEGLRALTRAAGIEAPSHLPKIMTIWIPGPPARAATAKA